jgi:Calcineurin-like phosphoesterase
MFGTMRSRCTIVAVMFGMASSAAQAEMYGWTQFTAQGLEARAVTDAPVCPSAMIDGKATAMTVRAAPGPDYPVTTCALLLQPTTKTLAIGELPIALPLAPPKRIAVVGDTGCRLKGSYIQACNVAAQWPFKQLAERLAADKPDLIIHVGDYHYRESPCPKAEQGCADSPYGDTWDVWRADFFAPAAKLLPVAPWVTVRGNHEDCQRGGKGWSRMLEPAPFDAEQGCNGPTPLYAVRLPKVTLAVVDTALAREEKVDPKQVELFREQYAGLAKLGSDPIWLLQHRPIWSAGGTLAGFPYGDNKTLAAAARTTLPASVSLMLSGHHHIFQALNYGDGLPPQIVSGHGGDFLNTGSSVDPTGWSINGVTVTSGLHDVGTFGYVLMEPQGEGWVATNFDIAGKARHRCGVVNRQVACKNE